MKCAIIPARAGSKRIPHKNIRHFYGRPMLAWSIDAALESGCFDRVIVSTDSEVIAAIARDLGAETPFIRPDALSDDFATTAQVINHCLDWLKVDGNEASYACCIYATAPFLQANDLQRGWEAMAQKEADFAFSVASFSYPIQRALKVNDYGHVSMIQPECAIARSQDLEETFHDAGQFYWGRAEAFLEEKNLFSEGSVPVFIPRHRVQDIDTEEDWIMAELMFQALQNSSAR